jgi:hypothetical protein
VTETDASRGPVAALLLAEVAAVPRVVPDRVIAVPVTTVWSSPEAPRLADHLVLKGRPEPAAWVRACATEPDHGGLLGRIETQALLGEPVRVHEERDGFARVTLSWQPSSLDSEGYPGWVPLDHLGPVDHKLGDSHDLLVVTDRVVPSYIWRGHGVDGEWEQIQLSYGTVVSSDPVSDAGREVEPPPALGSSNDGVEMRPVHAGGRTLWVPAPSLAPLPRTLPRSGAEIVAEVERFLGLGYLWGGMSGFGIDCSGLVHLVHRRLGMVLARDAHDQSLYGVGEKLSGGAAGGLVFFARGTAQIHHVGILSGPGEAGPGEAGPGEAGPGEMVHAPMSGHTVERRSLSDSPYRETVVAVRRTVA